jgi:hypothetical protein
MPDYSLGKVYKIVGNGKVYVGSTTRPLLCQRLAQHKGEFKAWMEGKDRDYITSFECISDQECRIELLESYPCNNKDELHRCETKWMKEIECVNKYFALGFSQKEYDEQRKEQRKQYYQQNKERFIKNYKDNIEHIKERKKKAYEKNKDEICRKAREHRAKKKLLTNNSVPINPSDLPIKIEPQEANLIVEHE